MCGGSSRDTLAVENHPLPEAVTGSESEFQFGTRVQYRCGPARRFQEADTGLEQGEHWVECQWNGSWTGGAPPPCIWTECTDPPAAPATHLLATAWDGRPVEFHQTVGYSCSQPDALN